MASKCKLECSDISVAYVVVLFFKLFCCICSYCCHHQCGHHGPAVPSAAFLPRSEDPTSRTRNKKRRTKQLHIQKEDGGRKEKRCGKQSSRTSELTGRVATAKGKRGGAIRVHSISSMDHINRNSYFFILAQMLRDARIENRTGFLYSSLGVIQECLLEGGGGREEGGRGRGEGGGGGNISWICYRNFCWCDGEIDCMVV